MTIQRKRVAKRLASGLVAGALALGGLAISGGTASANTPSSLSTNRISGADRYETAVAIARNQLGSAKPTTIIVASGENPADALAGASLINDNSQTVMILVRKDSIPESVTDFIADYKADLAANTSRIYVLGGTSAVSADVFDAIKAAATTAGDLTPPTVTRLAGDTRYDTAKAIADVTGVTDASDTLIIVNGEDGKWADALSAGQIAAEKEWPIALVTSSGLSAAATAQINALFAAPGSSAGKYLIIGGPAVVPTSVESYLISLGVPPASIQRIAGADRYQTNFLVQTYSLGLAAAGLTDQLVSFGGDEIALVSGENPFDALVSASWAAKNNAHIVLTPTAGGNINTVTLAATLAGLRDKGLGTNATLYVLGGRSAVADSAKIAYAGASVTDLTSTLTCPSVSTDSASSKTLTLALSGRLNKAAVGTLELEAMTSVAAMASYFKKAGATLTTSDVGAPYDAAAHNETSRKTFEVTLSAVPTVGTTITFNGWVEGTKVGSFTPTRSIAGSSCTIGADTTRPTLTLRVIPGAGTQGKVTNSSGPRILLAASEAVSVSTAANNLYIAGTRVTGSATVTNLLTGTAVSSGSTGYGSQFLFQLPHGGMSSISALATVEFRAAGVRDRAGNTLATTVSATAAADVTAPTLILDGVSSTASAQARYVVGSLSVSAAANGTWDGAKGSDFTIKVTNQRGLESPTIVIDETAKTIVVTADTGYHTVNDVKRAALIAGYTAPVTGNWVVGIATGKALTDKITANLTAATCGNTCGKSRVTVSFVGSEPFYLANAGLTATVGGLGVPFVDDDYTSDTQAYAAATDRSTGLRWYREINFTTSKVGAGTISFTGNANGVNDVAGNNVVGPLTFTVS